MGLEDAGRGDCKFPSSVLLSKTGLEVLLHLVFPSPLCVHSCAYSFSKTKLSSSYVQGSGNPEIKTESLPLELEEADKHMVMWHVIGTVTVLHPSVSEAQRF